MVRACKTMKIGHEQNFELKANAFHRFYLTIGSRFERALSSYGVRGKFGKHEGSVRVVRGDSRG